MAGMSPNHDAAVAAFLKRVLALEQRMKELQAEYERHWQSRLDAFREVESILGRPDVMRDKLVESRLLKSVSNVIRACHKQKMTCHVARKDSRNKLWAFAAKNEYLPFPVELLFKSEARLKEVYGPTYTEPD
jgi:hypothetical protein